MMRSRRGVILPIVLVVIGLLALTMAGFVFFVRAELAGTSALTDGHQARLVVDSALEEVVGYLRIDQHNFGQWFDRPDLFKHTLIWSSAYVREEDPLREVTSRREYLRDQVVPIPAWRYSLVGRSISDVPETMRFGITPEAGKLNLNVAAEEQIRGLFSPLLVELQIENPEELIASFLDWVDEDDEVRDGGAESEYYNTLEPPFDAKNGPLDSVEELLLIKGFNAAVLYGEDTNRNGILDPNEDDGETSFPPYDNGDGILTAGLAPYVTVYSREPDTALDNKPRISLRANAGVVAAQMAAVFEGEELSMATQAFVQQVAGDADTVGQMRSAAELYQGVDLPMMEGDEGREVPAGLAGSTVTVEELPFIMDRFTVYAPEQSSQGIAGLININTAPARVLRLLPGITEEEVAALVAARYELDPEEMRTTAWPMLAQALSLSTFHAIAPYITTKAYQFHIEALGYADHVKLMRRQEWIIEMVGPVAQVKYWRNLTSLGMAWPIDREQVVVTNP